MLPLAPVEVGKMATATVAAQTAAMNMKREGFRRSIAFSAMACLRVGSGPGDAARILAGSSDAVGHVLHTSVCCRNRLSSSEARAKLD